MHSSTASVSAPGANGYYGGNFQDREETEKLRRYYTSEQGPVRVLGKAAEALGIEKMYKQTFEGLNLGWAPNGTKTRQNAGNGNDALWDLTLSAEKSVSVAYALGDDETRERIVSHMFAMAGKTVEFLEETMTARRGHGGRRHEPIAGLCAVAILHETSRYGDPQLHIHLLVFNTCLRQDHTFGALHSRDLYTHKKAIGRLTTAEDAAHWLSQGVRLETTEHGSRFAEVPQKLCDEASRGRAAILERGKALGVFSPEALEAINLDLRPPKSELDPEKLAKRWRKQGAAYGVDEGFVQKLFGRPCTPDQSVRSVNARRAVRSAISETELESSTFQAAEILSRAAYKCRDGRAAMDDIRRAVERELKTNVQVTKVGIEHGHQIYSTVRNETLERRALEIAENSRHDRQHVARGASIETVVFALGLDKEQARAVRLTTTTRGSIKLIEGIAGTGKTRTLDAVRRVEEAAGRRLIGAAPTGVAREELRAGAGMERCFTVAKLLELLAPTLGQQASHHVTMLGRTALNALSGPVFKGLPIHPHNQIRLGRRDTVIVDEAAMVGFHDMTRIMDACRRAGAKLILCGDDHQLGPVLAGASLFTELRKRLGAARLTRNWRQRQSPWLRQLNRHLVDREPEAALRLLVEKDSLKVSRGLNSPLQACVETYLNFGIQDPSETLVVASTRAQIQALNDRIQESRRERGDLGRSTKVASQTADAAEGRLHIHDRVVLRRNDSRVPVRIPRSGVIGSRAVPGGVVNGDFGTVVAAAGNKIRILLDRRSPKGRLLYATFDLREYRDVELGYAVTAARAQGRTVKRAYLLADSGLLDAEQGYVAMTRQAEDLQVFAHEVTLGEELRSLSRALRRSRREQLAVETRRRLSKEEIDAQVERMSLKLNQEL